MSYPTYYESFDYRQMLSDFPLGEPFSEGVARLSRDELFARQNALFMRCMARAWQVPFYQRHWGAQGIEPGDVRSLEDIARLPLYSKADLMKSLAEHPPYGDYHGWDATPPERRPVTVLHTTSGTTGRPQVVLFSPKSREVQALLVARIYRFQGLQPGDVVHSVYGHGMINGGHFIREAVTHYTNSLFLSAGTGKETRSTQQVELMRDLRVTVIAGFVDYIRKLAETAREMGLTPGVDLPIRMITGHVGRESRQALSQAWGGAQVFDWYGVADTGPVAAEGPDQDGLYLMEDAHYVELCEGDTGRLVADDEPGDLVVTSLYKDDIYPIIRFNTHDLSQAHTGTSALGLNLRRIRGILGRSDNMVKLRGINVYPHALGPLLSERPEFAGEFVCRVTRDASGRDEMTVLAEVRTGTSGSAELSRQFSDLLTRRIGVELRVEAHPLGALAPLTQIEQRQKPIRLIDERHGR